MEDLAEPGALSKALLQVTVVTHIVTPYQVEFFDAICRHGEIDVRAIYLADAKAHRSWVAPHLEHPFVDLAKAGIHGETSAAEWIASSDLVVFGHYRHPDALRWIHNRNRARGAWCFWGERPGFRFGGMAGRMYRAWKLKPLLTSKAPIWGIGQWAIDGYKKEFGEQRRYFNIPYFSDLDRFVLPRPRTGNAMRRLLFSGSLIERKGIDLLASAFLEVAREHDHVTLDIVGGGSLQKSLETELAPLKRRVTFHGFKQWEELPALYGAADILCVPSRYDGWGLVVPEGLAAGLPVIATDKMGAAFDLVRDGENGWVAKAGELGALKVALKKAIALADEDLARMASAAVDGASQHKLSDGVRRFEAAVAGSLEAWEAA